MARLRLIGFAGALVVAVLALGALAGAGIELTGDGFRVASSSAVFAFVAVVAAAVVATGTIGARTLDSTYW